MTFYVPDEENIVQGMKQATDFILKLPEHCVKSECEEIRRNEQVTKKSTIKWQMKRNIELQTELGTKSSSQNTKIWNK